MKISLVNFSSKNYLDIPIKIKVTPVNTKEFKVLSYSAVGEKEFYDNIIEEKKMKFDGKSYNFSYIVTSMNRAEKADYGLQLRILFEGKEEPKISISAKDVTTQDYDISHSPYQKDLNFKVSLYGIGFIVILFIVVMFLILIILGPIISLSFKRNDIKNRRKYAKELFDAIKSEPLQTGTTDLELRGFVASMLYKQELKRWHKKTIIGKWSLGMIEPDIADHTIEL